MTQAALKQNDFCDTQERLVALHTTLVKRIAYHMMARMPASVQVDDLIQAGMIGLLEAIRNFDEIKGASFQTYAGIRIRGTILDEMRKGDWVPRSVHRNARRISEVRELVESETGRDAKDYEIARAMEISIDEYHKIVKDIDASRLSGYEESGVCDDDISEGLSEPMTNPLEGVSQDRFKTVLVECIDRLPERERLVLNLYYDEELNLKEIGKRLGVTESRVSQIHSQAMLNLKVRVKDWIPASTLSSTKHAPVGCKPGVEDP